VGGGGCDGGGRGGGGGGRCGGERGEIWGGVKGGRVDGKDLAAKPDHTQEKKNSDAARSRRKWGRGGPSWHGLVGETGSL